MYNNFTYPPLPASSNKTVKNLNQVADYTIYATGGDKAYLSNANRLP